MLRSRFLAVLCLSASLFTLPACDSVDDIIDGPLAEAAANPGTWYFIETEGATCRDGSATGFGVRLQEGTNDLMIYLEGGGACFNEATCSGNPSSFGAAEFNALAAQRGNAGIFSITSANPVGDWNMVYVPYCTGDVHGGTNPDATVLQAPNLGPQQFVGAVNIDLYLDILKPALGDPDKVLLTGASAGGFGSLVNFPQVADRFNRSDLTLLDDSGPIFFADDVLSPQLGGGFIQQFGFEATLPAATVLFQPDGLQNIYSYLDGAYPDATFGLASHTEDQTIRYFFGFGQPDGTITGPEFAAGLTDIRSMLPDSWGTYYASGAAHTFIGADATYFGTSAGVALNDWTRSLLDGDPQDVGPDTP